MADAVFCWAAALCRLLRSVLLARTLLGDAVSCLRCWLRGEFFDHMKLIHEDIGVLAPWVDLGLDLDGLTVPLPVCHHFGRAHQGDPHSALQGVLS